MNQRRVIFWLLCCSLALPNISACAKPQQGIAPLPEVLVGIAGFSQPQNSHELLAGYMAENIPRIDTKIFPQLDDMLMQTLRKNTKRPYTDRQTFQQCKNTKAPGEEKGRIAAIHHWRAVGECMQVDFLLVPQVLYLQEREGSEMGVVNPARILMDIFLIDIRNQNIMRSHYDETQTPLSENLLHAKKFIERGGKWVTSLVLAREGMEKAIRELGL